MANWYDPRTWGDGSYDVTDPSTWSINPAADIYGFGKQVGSWPGKAYDKISNKEGYEAELAGMKDAHDQLGLLQKQQHDQRMADLTTAMGYFKPAQDLLARMYGGSAGGATPDQLAAMRASNKRQASGVGYFVGQPPPPPPPPPMMGSAPPPDTRAPMFFGKGHTQGRR